MQYQLTSNFLQTRGFIGWPLQVIPERVVHARGTSAKGVFKVRCFSWLAHYSRLILPRTPRKENWMCLWQVTDDITKYTSADLFSSVGKSTDVIVRFSQVTGLLGSPDWMRAPPVATFAFHKRA